MSNEVDPAAVLDALGYPNADRITPVSGGRDTALFRVERGDDVYALRVFRPDQLATSHGELLSMRAARAGGIPVPEVYVHGLWQDRPALLMSWCEGWTVLEAGIDDPTRAEPLGIACGELLAQINAIEVPDQYHDRSWLDLVVPRDHPLYDRLADIARHDRLLHLDFHPLNVMTDGCRITAVLDWANARAGDPRADLARSISILQLDADELPTELQPLIRAFERGMIAGYEASAGTLSDMPLFYAWAGLAMLRDLRARLANNPEKRARIEAWTTEWMQRVDLR